MPKKMKKSGKPDVHEELKGFDIRINALGEIEGNMDIEQINTFLNKEVDDKKLKHLKDEEE